ncbi:MAG: GTP-binding protein [Desulfobacterales bacterium]|nr:GTP-binding protein [Desulfobacterales bacterium]
MAIRVILITGFLGSGKTTFLNRLIQAVPRNKTLMILMNEFGEVGLDGTLIQEEDMDILEISKGSIFCVCVKTDFIRALNGIARDKQPDLLVIESTGVANPAALQKDLTLSIFDGCFQLDEQICMIDAQGFEAAYGTFASVEKQIESSSLFVINKTDLVGFEEIRSIKSIVQSFHSDPEFVETTHGRLDMNRFFPGNMGSGRIDEIPKVGGDELEAAIEALIEAPDQDGVPPDRLLSAVYTWSGDMASFEMLFPLFPQALVRAKGILGQGETLFLFNRVMAQNTIEPYHPVKPCGELVNIIVFIGTPEAVEELESLASCHGQLEKKSVFDPMEMSG